MKSHFTFSKKQRNGIFLLLILIVICQCAYFFISFQSNHIEVDQLELANFTKEIDSLKQVEIKARKPKIYPFNPNYITDFKGASLGMNSQEIDRLLAFRKQNKWINSTKQFQEVTKVSDSLLNAMAPFFKFPEWITNPKPNYKASDNTSNSYSNKPKTYAQKQDLNTATAQQLQKVNGVGKVLSDRIIKYRNKSVGGFITDIQLHDVYGLTPEVIQNITNQFTVKTPKAIKKLNINTATVDDLVTIPHIDYDLAHSIIEQRILMEGFNSINQLKKVKDFPLNKIKIIELYLHFEKEK
ncbi:helix-hairpin-helix domain-containing protein [Algibacter amylolyticus]|uniref:Helix-hairpin-helix domain-containing protein n=1 Tax=Algibacter amylolyticus TaxID=1608400 RepID=A0A5M7B9N7_9FLAO|nr:helix-hairpin-helix domain-containing protein [Algibacter amylolyticus]KAA5824035.1 helix-hairpin-helix domain-containing protein [Algibacter amylolyticus]MBB5269587.1 DNA uptake protein ComE-like DNA-binding protein [Algibacter amylolyticus]TSJ74512.1 helix-hairpin-helix domain-containing protein [Algibacter amylolyticus]